MTDFEKALEQKVHEAQDWTYLEEFGCECPLGEDFGASDLEEFARWAADWTKKQIMKNAVEGEIREDSCGTLYVYVPVFDKNIFSRKDKIKVLIIKEETL